MVPNIKIVLRRVRYVCGAQYNNCIAQMFMLSKSGAQYNNCIAQVFILSTSGAQYNNCIAQKKDINYI